MPDPKDDPKSSEWRPYIFACDQWHCRICGDRFLYSEMIRKHIASEHNETMPPSMYEYFHGAVWQKNSHDLALLLRISPSHVGHPARAGRWGPVRRLLVPKPRTAQSKRDIVLFVAWA